MPRTIRECLKHDIFAVEEGIRLGRPQDMLIDPEAHRVAVIILAMKDISQVATVLDGADVNSYAEDTLPVAAMKSARLAYQEPRLLTVLDRGLHFRGRDVLSTDGHNLGRIIDVLIDDKGEVQEYWVAKGLLRRLLRIANKIPPSQIFTAGENVAVVQAPAAEDTTEPMEPTPEPAASVSDSDRP